MQIKSVFKLEILVLIGLAAALFSSGCGCGDSGPRYTVNFNPGAIELSPGQAGLTQASLLDKNKPGPLARWSIPQDSYTPNYSKSLSSWTVSPSSGVNATTVTLTALKEIELDGSYYLGNANQFRLDVGAEFQPDGPGGDPYASGKLPVVVYDLKLGEVYRSITPTYVATQQTITKQRVVRVDADLVVEVLFDSSPTRYTFEATAELQCLFYEAKKLPDGGTSGGTAWEKLGQTPVSIKVGSDGKSARLQLSGDFSGVVYNQERTNQQVNIFLQVTARSPSGREVKGIFHLTKATNCVLC
jgi:hypothetical protein